jgi:hypothetical protein
MFDLWSFTVSNSFTMSALSDVVSFRLLSSKVPFELHMGDEGYAIVNEKLLCLKFHLQDTCFLVEREEFDDNGALVRIMYQNPKVSNTGTYFRVMPGSYTATSGLISSIDPHTRIAIIIRASWSS